MMRKMLQTMSLQPFEGQRLMSQERRGSQPDGQAMTPIDDILSCTQTPSYEFKNMTTQNEEQDNRIMIAKKKRALLKKSRPYVEQSSKPMFGGHDHCDHDHQTRNEFHTF